jgi:hypothetical protein
MTERLKAGFIYLKKSYKFDDGERKNKLLVQLNNPRNKEPFLFCLTTSQEKLYRKKHPLGCQNNSKYFFIKKCDYFITDTWLELHRVHTFRYDEILNFYFQKQLILLNKIGTDCLVEIKYCIERSLDIPEKYISLIINTI